MPEAPSIETCIVRFPGPGGGTAGLGILVDPGHVITCAHVVNTALGRDRRADGRPGEPVIVEFPLLDGSPPLRGEVVFWRPPPAGTLGGDDIAGLRLDARLPDGAAQARLSLEAERLNSRVSVLGFPPDRPDGVWASAIVRRSVGNGLFQCDCEPASGRVVPGFSGSPVYDDATERVIGMIATAPRPKDPGQDFRAISIGQLRAAWPEVLSGRGERAAARRRNRESEDLTILHVSGTRFTGADKRPFFGDLHQDLAGLAREHGLRPDLIVVTGDLADRGRPGEFRQAVRFLDELSEATEIPRRRIAVVPGSHDVSREACEIYFREMEVEGDEPRPPFAPKWRYYVRDLLDEFYEGTPAFHRFSADQPFTLFEMPELKVVVAGLNSTYADSHADDNLQGSIDENQLGWSRGRLGEYQERGWLRLAAVYHGDPVGPDGRPGRLGDLGAAHLVLHNGVPGTHPRRLSSGAIALATGGQGDRYQLVTVRPGSVARYARRYAAGENRWAGDTGIHRGGADWRDWVPHRIDDAQEMFPPGENRPDPSDTGTSRTILVQRNEFLERVAEATRIRFPGADITELPAKNYLRASVPREGGGTEGWVIGVTDGPPSREAIDRFADDARDKLASTDPSVRAELVYPATREPVELAGPTGLAAYAERRGIRLKSMVEYQRNLLDLTGLAAAQQDELADDRVYPAELYIEQRYQIAPGTGTGSGSEIRTGLVAQAVDWLGSERSWLVVVLGDFGRGKTAFLRQLARVLPAELSSVTPVLVELRSLEKGPTLDDLVAQQLIRRGVENLTPARLRYLIDSGRVALLFDGFDELELRVGYENAADYLRELIGSVSAAGQAKLVLTSRTQHFRSTDQVRTALGQEVESTAASRIVILEEFSDDQVMEFLIRYYGGDQQRARERLDQVGEIGNLADLAHNPRMLSFIADLRTERMRAALNESGQVNAARLYEQIIDSWLDFEAGRQRGRRRLPQTITKDERFEACAGLALRLWQSGDPHLALSDLTTAVTDILSDLVGFPEDQAAHVIGGGSLLVRTGDGIFTFIHQSVMEWFVAHAIADDFEILSQHRVSRLMAEFITDLAEAEAISRWASRVLASGPDIARKNAHELTRQNKSTTERISGDQGALRTNLADLDVRGQDLNGQDLSDGDHRNATLRGMRLEGVDLTGADLSGADMTGATMVGGSLREATLTGSKWDRAAILGTGGLASIAGSPELAAAAIPGRDPAEAMFVPPGECDDVAFSPDGTLLAIARGHAVQLAEVVGGGTLRVLHGHTRGVTSVAFSPNGALLATASRDGTARLWDVPTGAGHATLAGHDGWVTAVAFSPDSGLAATASRDGTARTWDTATGRVETTFTGHGSVVTAVAFCPDGALLATASRDGTARTWGTATGRAETTFTGHDRPMNAVAFSADGKLLAAGSADGTARIWETRTGEQRSTIACSESVTAVAFSGEGTLLAASYGTRIEVRDIAADIQRTTFREHDRLVTGVAFSPDGTLLATTSLDGAHIWSLESGTRRAGFTRAAAAMTTVAFPPDGALATVDDTGTVCTWDTRTGARRTAFTAAHTQTVTTVAFSPDKLLVATTSRDDIVRTWTAAGRKRDQEWLGKLAAVAFSPDGADLSAVSFDGTVRTWITDGLVGGDQYKVAPADAMAFSADGHYLATAVNGGTFAVYLASSGQMAGPVTGHGIAAVSAVAVSRDGTLLAVASRDGTADVWDARAGERVATLAGCTLAVTGLAFSPDGTLIATGRSDGTARLWEAATGYPVATFVSLPGGGHATLLPGGAYKLSDDTDDIWWAVKLRRFGPGNLDPYVEGLRRLAPDEPVTR